MQQRLASHKLWLNFCFIVVASCATLIISNPIMLTSLVVFLFVLLNLLSQHYKGLIICLLAICTGNIIMSYVFDLPLSNILSISSELATIVKRLILLIYCSTFLLLCSVYKEQIPRLSVGSFFGSMRFPLIWVGPIVPIWSFIVIGLLSNIITYLFFIDLTIFTSSALPKVLIFASLFALINAVLEEVFWRGFILNKFMTFFGSSMGLIVTSIVFGLYHYAFGMPWYICMLFIIGGLYMGDLAIKAKGLLPITVFHFVINFGMFLLLHYH